jgi:hypothetical protein
MIQALEADYDHVIVSSNASVHFGSNSGFCWFTIKARLSIWVSLLLKTDS